jgi:hypothetical protein
MMGNGVARSGAAQPREGTEVHTRILRVTLAEPECRAYWEHVDLSVDVAKRAALAFEQRWFGAKSMARVQTLVAALADRFDPFPEALDVLRAAWPGLGAPSRVLVCHLHLQLTDPVYRAFTGDFLVQRRASGHEHVERDQVERWVHATWGDRWAAVTRLKFASNLLTAAGEAGLVGGRRDPRSLTLPVITDEGIVYCLYLLRNFERGVRLIDNLYLASVGLSPDALLARLRGIDAVQIRRLGDVVDVEWAASSLQRWAERARGASLS